MENDAADSSRLTEGADRQGTYQTSHDPDGPATVSDTVIEAIATVAEVDPTTTVIPLSDHIDPDALDALFTDCGEDVQVRFSVCGLDVVVQSDGHVQITYDSVPDIE